MNNLQKSFFPMAKSQLMSSYFVVGQGAVLSNICQRNLQKFGIKFWMLCDVKTAYVLRAYALCG